MLRYLIDYFRPKSNRFKDFEDFKKKVSWFVKSTDKINIEKSKINLTDDFKNTFPKLSKLIKTARVLDIWINDDFYKLYSWSLNKRTTCGWLCKQEPKQSSITLLPEHQLLLDNIGGIKESYNQPDDSFTNNQNFLFIKSKCSMGLDWEEYYLELCKEEKITPMPYDNLLSFVDEANGARTLYDLVTGQIYLFSHDHSFDYVTFVEGQPRYTFHLINNVNNFVEYVEEIACQWGNHWGLRL